ncbi:histidine kinase [Scytonema hofmannii FACHB-248]|uniref:Histidine kinase n=1 Tax=Scytonema hofmannii FACHB-248 TaxID=1842502 RepID=A0ABR8GZF3_9CYAN|nr:MULTISPECIES: histidine kinase [Nostocales]MBD2608629.1 histidine kinase [Scytonema hofmannii FACHB-248]
MKLINEQLARIEHGAWGVKSHKEQESIVKSLLHCPLPTAPCPLPHAPCPLNNCPLP